MISILNIMKFSVDVHWCTDARRERTEKGSAGYTSTVYKCIMVKCNLDTEVEDKDIRIKVAYNTQDHYIPLCKENVHIYTFSCKMYIFN